MKDRFIEPMLLLRTEKLPEGPPWIHEFKLDGYRALAIKAGGKVQLRSRNDNDFSARYTAHDFCRREYPQVRTVAFVSNQDTKNLEYTVEAVRAGKLTIPIGSRIPLRNAAEAHATLRRVAPAKCCCCNRRRQ